MSTMRNSVMLIGTISALVEVKNESAVEYGFKLHIAGTDPFTITCLLGDKMKSRRAFICDNGGVFVEKGYRVAIDGALRLKDGFTWVEVGDFFIIEKSVKIAEPDK